MAQKIGPRFYTLSYTYDLDEQLYSASDSATNTAYFSWYYHGPQPLAQSASLGSATFFSRTFDTYGRVIQDQDRNGVTVTNGYDFLGRLIARQRQGTDGTASGLETFIYGPLGFTNYFDPMNRLTAFVRDEAGRVTARTNANNEVLQYAYNPAGQVLSLTDGKNQTNHWQYDSFGRVTDKVDNAGNSDFVFQYDALDRITNRWTPAKGKTVFRYDPLGNLTNVDYSGGTVSTPSISYGYNALNRLTNMDDGIGVTLFTWTAGDQLADESGPWTGDAISYVYNAARQRASMSLLQPNAAPWTTDYGYDSTMRLCKSCLAW